MTVQEFRFEACLLGGAVEAFRDRLADLFGVRPEAAAVYGEWRNEAGDVIPDYHLLLRIPRPDDSAVQALREFIRSVVLATPGCDQDSIYLSSRWRGEFVARA